NLGVEPSTDTMGTVISRLATKLKQPFASVRKLALADAVKLLDDDVAADDCREAGKANKAKGIPGTPQRRRGQALTDDVRRTYDRVLRIAKKLRLPHRASGNAAKVAAAANLDLDIVRKALKWGRRHHRL